MVVPELIDSFSWAAPTFMFSNSSGITWREVISERPASNTQFGGFQTAMKTDSRKHMTHISLF